MLSQPTIHYKQSGAQVIKVPAPIPTASLLAYWDAGLTSSFSSSNQQTWYDLSGNNYHLTLSGSTALYVTASGASALYNYSPAISLNGSGGYYIRSSSDLCDAFNPTSSGYFSFTSSLCSPGPFYLDNVDYTVIWFGNPDTAGGGMGIGDKLTLEFRAFPSDARFNMQFEKTNPSGSTGGNIFADVTPSINFDQWAAAVSTKVCSGSRFSYKVNSLAGYAYTSPYGSFNTNLDNTTYAPGDAVANNKLVGTGSTSIGFNYTGLVQAVLVYNKALSPTQIANIVDYFKFRKLD